MPRYDNAASKQAAYDRSKSCLCLHHRSVPVITCPNDQRCVAVNAERARKRALLQSYAETPAPTPMFASRAAPCPLSVQLAAARAEHKAEKTVHAIELRASQDRFDHAMQAARQQAAPKPSYFSQIMQLFIVVLLSLILFKLGCLRVDVSFSPLALCLA